MSLKQFGQALEEGVQALTQTQIENELAPLLPKRDLAGLSLKMKVGLMRLRDCLGEEK